MSSATFFESGGIYVIEDWDSETPEGSAACGRGLTDLVVGLVELTASSDLVKSLSVLPGFVVVERGWGELPEGGFTLASVAAGET